MLVCERIVGQELETLLFVLLLKKVSGLVSGLDSSTRSSPFSRIFFHNSFVCLPCSAALMYHRIIVLLKWIIATYSGHLTEFMKKKKINKNSTKA